MQLKKVNWKLKFLFKIGGDLSSRNDEGNPPLLAATQDGHTEVIRFILANMIDKNPISKG